MHVCHECACLLISLVSKSEVDYQDAPKTPVNISHVTAIIQCLSHLSDTCHWLLKNFDNSSQLTTMGINKCSHIGINKKIG